MNMQSCRVCRDRHQSSKRRYESGSSDDEYGGYVPRKRQEAPQPGMLHAYALAVDSGNTNRCSRIKLSFPVLQRLGTVQAILTLMQP